MIVRWRLAELPAVLEELGIHRPLVVASPQWRTLDLPAHAGWWEQVPAPQVEVPPAADGLLAVGGGSAIDTAKHASAETGLPVVSVPTTYSGAEWPSGFGVRTPDRRIVGSGGGARMEAIVYDVELTLALPRDLSAGTAMNALAHCAEALYVRGRNDAGDEQALLGAPLIDAALPAVLANTADRAAREQLLRGAAHAGHALALAGLGLAHALAQALGGTYGLPHGAMNALCLPPALAYNRTYVPDAIERLSAALGADAVERTRELARLGGVERLRDFGVPREDLPRVAAAATERAGNRANPHPASPGEAAALLDSIW